MKMKDLPSNVVQVDTNYIEEYSEQLAKIVIMQMSGTLEDHFDVKNRSAEYENLRKTVLKKVIKFLEKKI
jgi:hypothetical protein